MRCLRIAKIAETTIWIILLGIYLITNASCSKQSTEAVAEAKKALEVTITPKATINGEIASLFAMDTARSV